MTRLGAGEERKTRMSQQRIDESELSRVGRAVARSALRVSARSPQATCSCLLSPVFRLLISIFCLLPFVGCAGYRLGNQGLFPADIQTVYVPIFESDSLRRNLGERLTEAVCKEIERRAPLKIASADSADSVLTGRIVGEEKHVLVNTLTGDPREYQVTMRVQVTWVDRRGTMLRKEDCVPLPPEVTDVSASANLVPEVGQSMATQQQEAINRVAQQIVNLMEAPW